MIILNLVLKRQWFNMYDSGEKTEEYRDIKEHWTRIFVNFQDRYFIKIKDVLYSPGEVTICFLDGYTRDRRKLYKRCTGLKKGIGRKEWGASGEMQYILSVGEDENKSI